MAMSPATIRTVQEETFESVGGIRIHLRSWQPVEIARAVVVICHGFSSHGGQYAWTGEQLAEAGFAAFALDMRGRGKSEGERFYVEDVSEYVADVAGTIKIAKSRYPGKAVFLLGHSAGGVVSATYVLDHQAELAGFICEDFAFQVPAPGFALSALKAISHVAPRLPSLKLKTEDFSRDPKVVEQRNADPLTAHEAQPVMTMAALIRADERLKEEFPRITLPLLILHGTADKITLSHGSQFFYNTAGSKDKQLKLYDGHYHDLLADLGKETVIADIRSWIEKHLTT